MQGYRDLGAENKTTDCHDWVVVERQAKPVTPEKKTKKHLIAKKDPTNPAQLKKKGR